MVGIKIYWLFTFLFACAVDGRQYVMQVQLKREGEWRVLDYLILLQLKANILDAKNNHNTVDSP